MIIGDIKILAKYLSRSEATINRWRQELGMPTWKDPTGRKNIWYMEILEKWLFENSERLDPQEKSETKKNAP
jgi:hypothetical protein